MMKLSIMRAVDSTVDAHGSSPVAEHILAHWGHDRGSVRFFRSSANFVYSFRNKEELRFLRFAESSERTRETIEAEMDILHWVARAGITLTTPISSRNGNDVETVVTDTGTFHGVVFAGLEGSQLDIGDLGEAQFRQWGAALGKLHAALQTYAGPGASARIAWRDLLEAVRLSLPERETTVRSEYEQVVSKLGALPVTHENYGLVHFDFELDNLYWRVQSIAIGDFDDCSHSWYVADIVFALRELFSDRIDMSKRPFQAFMRGYSEQYPLDEELFSQLPLFFRMSKLITYARLVRAMDLPDDPGYPTWLRSLRLKLQSRIDAYETSLVPPSPPNM